jgi:hypothetical protein
LGDSTRNQVTSYKAQSSEARAQFSPDNQDYRDLLQLRSQDDPHEIVDREFGYPFKAQLSQLFGVPCLTVNFHVDFFASAVFFLDADSLQPLRTPIITQHRLFSGTVVEDRHYHHYVGTLTGGAGNLEKLVVWDLSQMTELTSPAEIGRWVLRPGDASNLIVRKSDKGWVAIFVLNPYCAKVRDAEICAFSWPEKTEMSLATYSEWSNMGMALLDRTK